MVWGRGAQHSDTPKNLKPHATQKGPAAGQWCPPRPPKTYDPSPTAAKLE